MKLPGLQRAAILILMAGLACPAADEQSLASRVEAAFILNFTKFIEWPKPESEGADPESAICIIGDDPFAGALDSIVEGERLNSRKLVVRRVHRPAPKFCQVLFVGKLEKDVPALLAELGPGVLTVGEDPRFLRDGGMIGFVIENRRVRFDINQSAAARGGLIVSSRLLNVARAVEK
jgi:hypothetical protein